METFKKNFNSKKDIFNYILGKYSTKKDLVLIRGSTAYADIKEYSDLDVEIYSSKRRSPVYELIFYNNKIILLTIYFYKFQVGNISNFPNNVKVLQGTFNDKINSIFEDEISQTDSYTKDELIIRKRQLILDFFFKYMRSNDDELLSKIQDKIKFKE